MFTEERCTMPSESQSTEDQSSAVPITPTSHSEDGSARKTSDPVIRSWQHPRPCEWCGEMFTPRYVQEARKRFCGTSCSAKWRTSQPEHKAKVHNQEVAKKSGEKRKAWLASGNPKGQAELERIRALNPTAQLETREKISRRLKEMHHKPSVRGGNGTGLTVPQQILLDALGDDWKAEYVLSLGVRTPGYPTNYKLDIANPKRKIAIEVDGESHHSRRASDQKKDAKLASLGWTVLRFWNKDILTWKDLGMPMDGFISTTLVQHDIHLSV